MWAYIFKRLLLMVPTLLGVLLLTFVVVQFVPGGPVEQYLAEAKASVGRGGEGGGLAYRGNQGVDPQRIEQIKALYGFDKPAHERSEEHTSELQSPCNLVCRLLLEKKKTAIKGLKTQAQSNQIWYCFNTPSHPIAGLSLVTGGNPKYGIYLTRNPPLDSGITTYIG